LNHDRLIQALSNDTPNELAEDLVRTFLEIRQDVATRHFGRVSAGKFVETTVQILQNRAEGSYDKKPDVEGFLSRKVENCGQLDDGLRICCARIARSAYTLRNKRNIAHKGAIDPNAYDLSFLHSAATWIMAELLRQSQKLTMEEAGSLIELIHAPINRIVENIDGHSLVHGDFSTKEEILVLMRSRYPDGVETDNILSSLQRRSAKSVENRVRELFSQKLIHGSRRDGYRLTITGFNTATEVIARELTRAAA